MQTQQIESLTGAVEYEAKGKAGTYQVRKSGGSVEYVAGKGTIYHPVTYMIVHKTKRGKGEILLSENPGRGSRDWLEAARALAENLANGDKPTRPIEPETRPEAASAPLAVKAQTDANPYEVISAEIQPTLEVISSAKALMHAIERAGLREEEFGQCVSKGLDTLRLKLADQLVERNAGGWLSGK